MRLGLAWVLAALVFALASATPSMQGAAQPRAGGVSAPAPAKLADFKKEAAASIDGMYDFTQQMVDSVFSFGELGFQEYETQ